MVDSAASLSRRVGREEGRIEGREEGRKVGRAEGLREAVKTACLLLDIELDADKENRLGQLDAEQLETLKASLLRNRSWPS